ncbi:MAG: insulinase family protein [Phycisphaerae bacterium]|nr:insulinase family protein [Phycisphaerae bacterium]
MKRTVSGLVLVLAFSCPSQAQEVPAVEKSLSNGMRVLMVERHTEPTIAGGWVAHVGSSNERPGITGIAHLFEHMMFKGSTTIGTKDNAKDQEIIASQEVLRDQMREEEARMRAALRRGHIDDMLKPENATPRWRELKKQFDELITQQRANMVKDEFDLVYTAAGGSHLNAFTSNDQTAYFVTVPANKLELWMWMESDRLLNHVFREFYSERDVVQEERRLGVDSTPLGKAGEAFEALAWGGHPYAWPVVGWPSDLPAITKAQADEFFAIYYAPQNITLVLVGDLKPDAVIPLAERYFGRISRGSIDPPEVITADPRHPIERRMNAQVDANPQVWIAWQTVASAHRDAYPLAVLCGLLEGRTGRLHKALVLKDQIATSVSAADDCRKWAGSFAISAEAREPHTPAKCEQAVYTVLDRLARDDVPAEELQKVKNQFAAREYRKLANNYAIFMQLIHYDGQGNWREINEAGPKLQAVTAADVRRVVNRYFTPENRAVALLTRKPPAVPPSPTEQ